MQDAARRYLAIGHGSEAITAHRLVVDRVRAVARRRGDARWRLVGLELRTVVGSQTPVPSIDEWAETKGLTDWSQAELAELYAEEVGSGDPQERRRSGRNIRLRDRQLQLLRELEAIASEKAAPSDLLDGWFPAELAGRFRLAGLLTLDDLRRRVGRGGRWWLGLTAIGPKKAARMAAHVGSLLGEAILPGSQMVQLSAGQRAALSGRAGSNRASGVNAGTAAQDDREAVRAWVAARSGSPYTAKQYEREAERFILWCLLEPQRALSDATSEDCRAYMDFLEAIPDAWISRRHAVRLEPGWAPFKGQLSVASRQLAVTVLNSLFEWLVSARYLASNPWVLVNRKLGDDPGKGADVTSRAFTPKVWAALRQYLDAAPQSSSVARLRWLCTFVEATGLRAAELLRAQVSHFSQTEAGWVLRVHGKGRRNRTVPVPSTAIDATRNYLSARGFDLHEARPGLPLLASLVDPAAPISYGALQQTFGAFVRRALAASDLTRSERHVAEKASAHWLRHTHATRAAERNMPPDVLQENLGQSDPRMTAHYYRAQIERRQRESERVFGKLDG